MKSLPRTSDTIDTPEHTYLYVSMSQLPHAGNGLHTTIPIYKDEVIAVFTGELLTDRQADLRAAKGKDKYFISMLDGSIMDSMHAKCLAKYANDAKGSPASTFKNNGRIVVDENQQVCIIATRNIKQGEEIFCGYGKRYWDKHYSPQSIEDSL